MTEEEQSNKVTTSQRYKAYKNCPGLLIEELNLIITGEMRPEHCAVYHVALNRIRKLCPDRDRLLRNVANAVLKSVKGE